VAALLSKHRHTSRSRSHSGLGAAAATPPVTGYRAWWDATALTALADGAALTSWPDGSANGWTLTPGGAPTFYKTTAAGLINGHPAVTFSGSGQWLHNTGSFPAGSIPLLVLAVVKLAATPVNWVIYDLGGQANGGAKATTVWAMTDAASLSGGATDLNPHQVTFFHAASGGTRYLRVDGTQVASSASSFTSGDGAVALGAWTTGSNFWNGLMGEVIVYTAAGAVTAPQVAATEAYLKAKWGTP
jgi:hypothetical protein